MAGTTLKTTVIGIDFSTDPAKTGLARATVNVESEERVLHDVCTGTAKLRPPMTTVVGWVRQVYTGMPVLIAIDAPLGWPDAMRGHTFTSHMAGDPLEDCADRLFSRETDRQIKDRLGKKPLEVGANLIARSAHGALRFLQELSREIDGQAAARLPLAWLPGDLAGGQCVVEVYPAATMKAHGISAGNYKKSGNDGREARKCIVECLKKQGWSFETDADDIARNDHMVDAAVCVLAGWDFLANDPPGPNADVRQLAEREGWIWAGRRC